MFGRSLLVTMVDALPVVGRGGAKAQQTKTGLMEVYADVAAVRPLATEVVARVARACGVEKAAPPPLKATLRMLEKALLRPGGLVLSDQPLSAQAVRRLPPPEGVQGDRYFIYRAP